ncbi:hypothetical protein [uncultured Porphyromonas sp.]|nr:hypothetical protein [uncultured Porphyromonas sp.]
MPRRRYCYLRRRSSSASREALVALLVRLRTGNFYGERTAFS